MRLVILVAFLNLILAAPSVVNGQAASPQSLFLNMIDAMNKVQTLRYQFVMNERINNTFILNKYLNKVQVKPLKVYTYCLTINVGAEVLYIEGANNNKAIVKPNRFPWFNLNLSPRSMLLREDHLFTIDQSGFAYMSKVFQHYYNTNRPEFLESLKLSSDTSFEGKPCYQLVLDYAGFKWQPYTVLKGETFTSIAEKLFLNDYMIMERNKKKSLSDVHENEKILVPSAFAKKIILFVDKKSLLPVEQILFDDKGLLIVLQFRNLVVNQPIPAEEFTTDYKEYGF